LSATDRVVAWCSWGGLKGKVSFFFFWNLNCDVIDFAGGKV